MNFDLSPVARNLIVALRELLQASRYTPVTFWRRKW